MNAVSLLNELEEELRDKRGVLTKKDTGRCVAIIDRLKESLPLAIEESEYIVAQQQQILKNADVVAKNTIRAAEERAMHLVGTTELMRKAEEEARQLLERTSAKCDLLVRRTKEHLDKMFMETEQFLLSTLSMIRTNREELRSAMLVKRD